MEMVAVNSPVGKALLGDMRNIKKVVEYRNPPLIKVHFIGIGGIGISALARWFLAQKWAVSGSDIAPSDLTNKLKKEGVKVKIGHKKAFLSPKTALVIYNQAIPAGNSELLEAEKRGIPTLSYPRFLGLLTRRYKTIAIAGAHGKSTTTALVSLILKEAGFDPTVIIGTKLKEFNGKNFRAGRGDWLVIEADEWKASFLNYSPAYAVITGLDREHLDYYKSFPNVKKTFLKFMKNIKSGGVLILNKNDKNLYGLKSQIQKIAEKNKLRLSWYSLNQKNVAAKIKKILKVPGRHNLSNALAAYSLAKVLKIKEQDILTALSRYGGAWRRMEYKGQFKILNFKFKIKVFDDYAHHPTEIKASLAAFREKYPNHKLICVFQPHQADRLKRLFKEFKNAFNDADYLVLLPIYNVAGRDKTYPHFTSERLSKLISHSIYLSDPKKLKEIIKEIILKFKIQNSKFIVVMMGAGDIVNYTKLLIK